MQTQTLKRYRDLSLDTIVAIDRRGGDLEAMITDDRGRYSPATIQRIVDYLNRPCDPCPNGSGEYY